MSWPQWVWIAMVAFSLGISGVRWWRMRSDGLDLLSTFLGSAVTAWLLYMGGFFGGRA